MIVRALHALVIEDHFLIASLIEDELTDLGYASCDIVDTESAAIEAARVRCPDLITADDRLATGTGVAAVQAICAAQIIPVIFIVGESINLIHGVRHACVIGKPFGGARLREAVAVAIVNADLARATASGNANQAL